MVIDDVRCWCEVQVQIITCFDTHSSPEWLQVWVCACVCWVLIGIQGCLSTLYYCMWEKMDKLLRWHYTSHEKIEFLAVASHIHQYQIYIDRMKEEQVKIKIPMLYIHIADSARNCMEQMTKTDSWMGVQVTRQDNLDVSNAIRTERPSLHCTTVYTGTWHCALLTKA